MWRRRVVLSMLVALWMVTGCTTPYGQGRSALRQGNYDEAARYFEQALAQDPNRVDALAGLGIARYKEGLLDEAVNTLSGAVIRGPHHETAQLYLGLAYLSLA